MADSYREYQVLRAPPWMQTDQEKAWEQEMGSAKDALQLQIRQGVTARFPDFAVQLGAPDALAAIGADRNLPVGYGDTDQDYADQLRSAWDLWPGVTIAPGGAGSHAGMLRELKRLGFWPAVIVQDNGRYATIDAGGTVTIGWLMTSITRGRPDWRFQDPDLFYSRFAILFPGPTMPGNCTITARATFTNSGTARATWSAPFDDADYLYSLSAPVTSGGGAVSVVADETTKTGPSIDLVADAAFTGYVDLTAWRADMHPLFSPPDSVRNLLNETVRLWKPGKMTYDGAYATLFGGQWDWPIGQTWDDGDTWDENLVEKVEP